MSETVKQQFLEASRRYLCESSRKARPAARPTAAREHQADALDCRRRDPRE